MPVDVVKIKEQVARVIEYSQNIPDPKVDDLIDRWYENKKRFIDAFGGELILNFGKITFHLDENTKTNKVNGFIDNIVRVYGYEKLGNFIAENQEGFFDNRVVKEYDNIPRGMKLLRAFKYFEPRNKTILEALQNQASCLIQEDKIEGELCVSVHPLDFLSSSMNNYNWRSCHALDGEYRSGNLSYMVDNSTVVWYLKAKDNVRLPLFPDDVLWNDKKWRMLMYFSEKNDLVMAGRQYPFTAAGALNQIGLQLMKIKDLNRAFSFWGWGWEDQSTVDLCGLFSPYIQLHERLYPVKDLMEEPERPLHYNDLVYSNYYKPIYIYDTSYDASCEIQANGGTSVIHMGGDVKCLHCGHQWIDNPETMRCPECELEFGYEENDVYGTCDICGSRMLWDDATYMGDDYRLCPHCVDTHTYTCPQCGELIFMDERKWLESNEEYYCETCYTMFLENEEDY